MKFNPDFNRSHKPSVCYGCTERYATKYTNCHANCERYKAEVAERAESADQKRKNDIVFMENYEYDKRRRRR